MALQSSTALATITLQSDAAEVVFSSIPSIYRDLVLVMNINTNSQTDRDLLVRLNGDSNSANYSHLQIGANPLSNGYCHSINFSGFASGYYSGAYAVGWGTSTLQILDYAQNKHKAGLTRWSANGTIVEMGARRWASNSPVTSLSIVFTAGVFIAGSTFSLYGRIA